MYFVKSMNGTIKQLRNLTENFERIKQLRNLTENFGMDFESGVAALNEQNAEMIVRAAYELEPSVEMAIIAHL